MVTPTTPALTQSQLDAQYDTAVLAAGKALQTSTSDAYWNQEVTQASTLGKVIGFIKYCVMQNRISRWISGDSAKDATALEFQARSVDLVNALSARNLTLEETTKFPTIAGKITISAEQFAKSAETAKNAEDAEKAFYKVFKERCTQLSATAGDTYAIHHAGAMKVLAKQAETLFPQEKAAMGVKLETLNVNGQGRVFNDILEAFAKQPAASITVDSYKKLLTELDPATNRFCKNMTETEIATKLRNAIKAEHTGTALSDLATKFADATSAEYQALQTELRTKLDAEKVALELELGALCGPNGNDGTVHAAWVVLDTAQKALTDAETKFTAEFAKAFPGVSVTSTAAQLAKCNFATQPDLIAAQNVYNTKVTEVEVAQKAFNEITAKLSTLGQWTNGQLSGGKVFDAQTIAGAGFNAHVGLAANKLAAFYNELNTPINPNRPTSPQTRQNAMKAITG